LVRVSWVKGLFDRLPAEATAEVVTFHARAYTWVLVAGVLLGDRSGDHIPVHIQPLVGDPVVAASYSWGSAVLAWLYKVTGREAFFTGGSMRGTSDIRGFTLLLQLWALERFPHIAERYIDGGNPLVDDSIPRGVRWLPIIKRNQHRVAMRLEDIRYALDWCTYFVVKLLILLSLSVRYFIFYFFLTISLFLPYFLVDVIRSSSRRNSKHSTPDIYVYLAARHGVPASPLITTSITTRWGPPSKMRPPSSEGPASRRGPASSGAHVSIRCQSGSTTGT
ncbi:Serine/threonine-protein phosphatase 7 long form homolog, partial [Linum perenne]